MNATPQVQQLLFDLQSLDIDARKIRHEAQELEETKHLEQLIVQRKAIVIERKKLAAQVDEVRAQSDALEAEMTKLRTQSGSIDLKLKSSGVTPKEVIALTKQQETLKNHLSEREDALMEKMGEIETLEKNDAILASNDEKLHGAGLDLKNRRDDKIAVLKKRMSSVASKRKIAIASIPREVLDLYAQLEKRAQGNVVAQFVNGHVEGIHMEISPAQLHKIESAAPNELVVLEDEGVIVVRV